MSDVFPAAELAAAGLNRQHVFALAGLPAELRAGLAEQPGERQLILLGHAGRRLWDCVTAAGCAGDDPIDDYSRRTVAACLAARLGGRPWRIVYPGDSPVGLQRLGELAGWHHASPFMVGIDAEWGSWFAYRAVVLAASDFPLSVAEARPHPCAACVDRPCVGACPAGALADGFALGACSDFRLTEESPCAEGCLARQACPLGARHRYAAAQIRHSYGRSLAMLRDWRDAAQAPAAAGEGGRPK